MMCTRKNDEAARTALLKAYRRRPSARSLDTLQCWQERLLFQLFAGVHHLDLSDAVARSCVLRFHSAYDPELAGELLRWGVHHEIVACHRDDRTVSWSLLRHGATFIPRFNGDVDVRTAAPLPGGLSIEILASRETKLRKRLYDKATSEAIDLVVAGCRARDADTVLGEELCVPDLPPVRTLGELADNLRPFLVGMPLHRVRQIGVLLVDYPYPPIRIVQDPSDLAPPELADLRL